MLRSCHLFHHCIVLLFDFEACELFFLALFQELLVLVDKLCNACFLFPFSFAGARLLLIRRVKKG